MKNLRGSKQAKKLEEDILDLIGEFDEECTERGLPERMIDAHLSAIFINLLCLVVTERKTFSAKQLVDVTRKELHRERAA